MRYLGLNLIFNYGNMIISHSVPKPFKYLFGDLKQTCTSEEEYIRANQSNFMTPNLR